MNLIGHGAIAIDHKLHAFDSGAGDVLISAAPSETGIGVFRHERSPLKGRRENLIATWIQVY
ncbi:hypothetical protein D3C71_2004300 [compost metagenome]